MHLFVDANILLGFYGLSANEREEVRKLIALAKAGELIVCLPDQVVDEVYRNREKVLAEIRAPFASSRVQVSLPNITADLAQREPLESAVREVQRRHSEALSALDVAVAANSLEADTLIRDLLAVAKGIPTQPLLDRARIRQALGRPPGKGGSLGDALNWEALLSAVPVGEDLWVVTDDGDFFSPYNPQFGSEYLANEWAGAKKSPITFYRDLSRFTRENFPEIKLASDVDKVRAIQRLASSGSFASTHAVVADLSRFDLFSPAQARDLIAAAARNAQVRWIASDEDVSHLLARVIEAHRDALEPSHVAILEDAMYPEQRFEESSEEPAF